ncbi:hypothetical protein [Streptomyces sp. NPDC020298]|uniref:hypothetical protein n=1 Tax=unclassified Streptomyces TaxID=2593676 RepID=UPI0033FDE592
MARTNTAPGSTTEAPPDPPTQETARPSPVLAWPAEWPVPELPEKETRRRTRGLPMAPTLAGASNATALTTTAAYSAGGPLAAAAAGVVVVAGATVAVARRRASVRRSVATRSGGATPLRGPRSGGGSGLRSGPGAGSGRGGSGSQRGATGGRSGAGSGSRGGLWRSGGSSKTGSLGGGHRSGTGSGGGRSRSGLLRKDGSRHTGPGRHTLDSAKNPRQQNKAAAAAEKAAKKAIQKAAKTLAAKTNSSGKSHGVKAAAARAARGAAKASRPYLARAAKATARQAKRAGSALWDGVRALGSAAWTWLRTRDAGAALNRLKAVWARHRKNRNTPPAQTSPPVAATVRRPTNPAPVPTSGGTAMSGGGHHFVAPAMELARAAANYHPTGMLQVGADFAGLEEALRLHAEAMKITVENADATQPLDPHIVDLMRQIHGLQLKAAELASELQPAFRQLHHVDISRLENPRKGAAGERMWDVSANI